MRLLLDTNVVIWWLARSSRLGRSAQDAIARAEQVLVSAVTGYEINFKRTVGKLEAPGDLEIRVQQHGFHSLPVSLRHAAEAGSLPLHHGDPFDRLFLAQARCEGLTVVTADRHMSDYDVPILDATN